MLNSSSYLKYKEIINRSAKKLENSTFKNKFIGKTRNQKLKYGHKKIKGSATRNVSGYKLLDSELLAGSILAASMCKHCRSVTSTLVLKEKAGHRAGLAEALEIECTKCLYKTPFYTSKKISDKKSMYDVNMRTVYGSQTTGLGRTGLSKLCGVMDLPAPVTRKAFNNISKVITEKALEKVEEEMKSASERLFDLSLIETAECIDIDPVTLAMIANVPVTVDGTWQKRGHTSKIGVVFVLSVETGEVLDFVVKSLICHECVSHKNTPDFTEWYQTHENVCMVNHKGSSDSMETAGAVEIFLRSIETRNLKYTTFVGDGDSSCFGVVSKACNNKYGDSYIVVKEECVGHIKKRAGKGLREFKRKNKGRKLDDGKTVGGRGRLTDRHY